MSEPVVKVTRKGPRYEIAALLDNVERCKANIKTFEAAIDNERAQIGRLYDLVEQERARQAAGPPVARVEFDEG